MATQSHDFDGQLWFFTSKSSHKTAEIDADHRVNLAYSDPAGHRYVSISATARLVNNPAKSRELWTPVIRAWFPNGVDDPELRLLQVTPERAEYWESAGAAVRVIEFAKAIFAGRRAEIGQHGQINLASH
jgi:general stress protein 26